MNDLPESKHKLPVSDLKTFREISAELTGYSEVDLEGTGMLEEYLYTLMKEQDHEGVRAFFGKANEILNLKSEEEKTKKIKEAFIDLPPGVPPSTTAFDQMSYQGLAPRIILLWYTGICTTMNWKEKKSQQDRTAMVSADAYQQGLIWQTAGTHPSGAKQPGFGSWENPFVREPEKKLLARPRSI